MKQQALNFQTRVVSDDIVEVDFSGQPLRVIPASGEPVESQTVIVTTGARANYLGLDSEEPIKTKGSVPAQSVMGPCRSIAASRWP